MKNLFIMRHAKSSWDDASLPDFDRPLNSRGLSAAPFMGELMARNSLLPRMIISSPAKRAMETSMLVKESLGLNCDLCYDERIYEAQPITLHTVVSEIQQELSSALLVGHNPGIERFIRYLTGRLEPMPTAALAVVGLAIASWSDVTGDCGKLLALYRPKEEMAADRRTT